MRVALRQQPHQPAEVRQSVERMGRTKEGGGAKLQTLHAVMAEMLIEPRTPDDANGIAGLQDRTQPRPRAAPHEAEMPPMVARHHFEDGARLPVASYAEHGAFVG